MPSLSQYSRGSYLPLIGREKGSQVCAGEGIIIELMWEDKLQLILA